MNKDTSILVVDDNESIAMVVKEVLSLHGFVLVDVALNVGEARGLISRGNYDLVITDMEMPDGNGLDVLGILRRDCPRTKVIIHTGSSDPNVIKSILAANPDGFSKKPFDIATFLSLVEELLVVEVGTATDIVTA